MDVCRELRARRAKLLGTILVAVALLSSLTVVLSSQASAEHKHQTMTELPNAPERAMTLAVPHHITLYNVQKPTDGIASHYVITNLGTQHATTKHDYYDNANGSVHSLNSVVEVTRTYDLADIGNVPEGYEGYVIISADQPVTGAVLLPPTTQPTSTPYLVHLPVVCRHSGSTDPLSAGDTVRFHSWLAEVRLEGIVTDSEWRSVLYPDSGDPIYAKGIFVVALVDVTNRGLESGEVGRHGFRVQDSVGRKFDMAELEVLWAAEDMYDRESVYTPIQPGFTESLIFVFDVLPESESLHLVSRDPW